MGLNYHLVCKKCKEISEDVEFSIVGYISVKNIPDDYKILEQNWVSFLVEHSGHEIYFIDCNYSLLLLWI